MKRALFIVFFVLLFFANPAQAQTTTVRYAACDLCGYCPPSPAPASWESCRKCLYPQTSSDPTSRDTLKISDSINNAPPTIFPGHQYTMFGCLGTNLGGFRQQGAAASVVQSILNIIFSIVGGIAFLSLIYGAFIIMTSQSNPERLNYGKRIVYGAIIGAVFTLLSVFLVNLIGGGILRIPGFGSSP